MNIFTKIWNWLNGNKTVIGLTLLALTNQSFFKQLLPDHTVLYQAIQWLAGLLAGGGIVHKLAKANTQPGPTA
jgi:hypothetical protein